MMDRETFYIENVDRIFNLLLKMVGNKEEAMDLTHDTFLKFFKNEKGFRGAAQPYTYLYRIAINTGINHIRKRQLTRKWFTEKDDELVILHADSETNRPDHRTEERELDYLITRTMLSLPEKQAQCFYLSKVAGLPQKKIAEILQISVSAVESNVFRAKKELAKKLNHYLSEKKNSRVSNKNEKRQKS